MRSALVSIVTVVAVSLFTVTTVAAENHRHITVRVYPNVDLPSALETRALAEASAALAAASVEVAWLWCSGHTPPASCERPLAPGEFSLRILNDIVGSRVSADALGDAVVARDGSSAVLATVYFTRIAVFAKFGRTDVAVVLGRTAAHEIGHLLMQSTRHPGRGLMRPAWTCGELRQNLRDDWTFTAGDISAIHRPAQTD